MKNKRMLGAIIISSLFLLSVVSIGFTQTPPSSEVAKPKPHVVIWDGKIVHNKQYGGYIVVRVKPREEYKIVNENDQILSKFAQKGAVVKIEGNLRGAYFLTITKIDGQEYPGKQ